MPKCSKCKEEKPRDAYSKAQFRKSDATRRCKQCLETENCNGNTSTRRQQNEPVSEPRATQPSELHLHEHLPLPLQPPPPVPLLKTDQSKMIIKIKAAAEKVMQRGVPSGVGLDGFDRKKLQARLWEVVNNVEMLWLTKPLLLGLIHGGQYINHEAFPFLGMDPYSIIMWVCQYKNLKALFGYSGGDDIVALALSAGADVSFRLSNGCNTLFFAVKYGSAQTVKLLLDAGVRVEDRDEDGRTVWWNALERPDLDVIKLLIERCNGLIPLDEEVITFTQRQSREMFDYTLPEIMIFSYVRIDTTAAPNRSWDILGAPRMDDMATALIRVLQAGAQFSQSNTTARYTISSPLAFVTHVHTPESNEYTEQYSNAQLGIARMLSDVIYGRWLPDDIMKEVQTFNKTTCSPDNSTCPICLSDICPSDNPITLYCGHRFCLECIKECGKARNNRNPTSDKRCPICRRLLCGDVLDEYHKQLRARYGGLRLGIDRHEAGGDLPCPTRRGPHLLSDEQLRFECGIMIGRTEGTRESLLAELLQFQANHAVSFASFAGVDDASLELSSGTTINMNGSLFYAPRWGPAMLPIKVKGVPILASVSSNSIFTVIPKAVVRTFGLKTKPIRSSQFVSGLDIDHRVVISEVVDEFRFFLNDVEICLNNAVVLKKEKRSNRIQLGMDFFSSALWTRSSVEVQVEGISNSQEGVFVVSDGIGQDLFLGKQPDELRYYSRHGKICQVPFIYINHLTRERSFPVMTLLGGPHTTFGECQWCCRYFPCDGMLKCDDGTDGIRYYCDEDCKLKGMATRS